MKPANKTKHTLLPLAAALVCLLAVGCERTSILSDVFVSNVSSTECKSDPTTKGPNVPDSIAIRYINGTVFVEHYNLAVNCETETVDVRVSTSNDTIYVMEIGDGDANCVCEIDNFYQINNVTHGTYTIVIEPCTPTAYQQTLTF